MTVENKTSITITLYENGKTIVYDIPNVRFSTFEVIDENDSEQIFYGLDNLLHKHVPDYKFVLTIKPKPYGENKALMRMTTEQ